MIKNKKMLEELTGELEKIGIKKDQIDDYMAWGVMKLALGIMKIKWSLKENGISGDEAKKKLDKIIELVAKKDADELHKMMHKSGEDNWK